MPLSTLTSYKLTWGNSVFEHELATRMVGHGQFATVWHCGVTTGPNHSSHLTHPSHNTHKRSTKHSTYNGLSGTVDLYEYKHSRQAFKWSSTPLWAVRVNWKNMSTSHVSVQGSLSQNFHTPHRSLSGWGLSESEALYRSPDWFTSRHVHKVYMISTYIHSNNSVLDNLSTTHHCHSELHTTYEGRRDETTT